MVRLWHFHVWFDHSLFTCAPLCFSQVDSHVLVSLVAKKLPKVYEHCQNQKVHKFGNCEMCLLSFRVYLVVQLDLATVCAPWFLCLFIRQVPVEVGGLLRVRLSTQLLLFLRRSRRRFAFGTLFSWRAPRSCSASALPCFISTQSASSSTTTLDLCVRFSCMWRCSVLVLTCGIACAVQLFMFMTNMGRDLYDCDLLMKVCVGLLSCSSVLTRIVCVCRPLSSK